MAASASVAVARLGGDAVYWGRVGADPLGERILGELAAEGVDVSSVRRIDGCVSPSAAILVDDLGERLVCAFNDPALDARRLVASARRRRPSSGGVSRCALAGRCARRFHCGRAVRRADGLRRRHGPARRANGARPAREVTSFTRSPASPSRPDTSLPGEGLAVAAKSARGVVGRHAGRRGLSLARRTASSAGCRRPA